MVFSSLIQYATVGYFSASTNRQNPPINTVISDDVKKSAERNFDNKISPNGLFLTKIRIQVTRDPSRIDKYSRFLFPMVYSIFNLLYWTIYLNISSETIKDLIKADDV
jgi:hypothetical protein